MTARAAGDEDKTAPVAAAVAVWGDACKTEAVDERSDAREELPSGFSKSATVALLEFGAADVDAANIKAVKESVPPSRALAMGMAWGAITGFSSGLAAGFAPGFAESDFASDMDFVSSFTPDFGSGLVAEVEFPCAAAPHLAKWSVTLLAPDLDPSLASGFSDTVLDFPPLADAAD